MVVVRLLVMVILVWLIRWLALAGKKDLGREHPSPEISNATKAHVHATPREGEADLCNPLLAAGTDRDKVVVLPVPFETAFAVVDALHIISEQCRQKHAVCPTQTRSHS